MRIGRDWKDLLTITTPTSSSKFLPKKLWWCALKDCKEEIYYRISDSDAHDRPDDDPVYALWAELVDEDRDGELDEDRAEVVEDDCKPPEHDGVWKLGGWYEMWIDSNSMGECCEGTCTVY